MNERIKELIKQSYVWVKLPEPFYKTDDDVEGFLDFDKEKFAELLILECVQAVMDGTKEGDHYAMRIENHFDHGEGGILRLR